MKKFMTVLLVVAVMFTFSFGSAFAADTTAAQFNVNVTAAEAEALATLDATYEQVVKNLTDKELTGGWKIDKAQWALAAPNAYQIAKDAIIAKTAYIKANEGYAITHDQLMSRYETVLAEYSYTKLKALVYDEVKNEKGIFEAAKAQFAIDKAEFVANVGKVDTSAYSTVKKTTVVGTVGTGDAAVKYYTSKEYVEAVLADVVAQIEKVVLESTDTTVANVKTQYGKAKTLFTGRVLETKNADETYTYTFVVKSGETLTTTAQDEASAAQGAADKASQKAQLASTLAYYKANANYLNATDKTNPTKETLDKYVAAYEVAKTYLIEAGKGYTDTNTFNPSVIEVVINNVEQADKAIAAAEVLKAKVDENGKAVYDAEAVDKALASTLETVYAATTKWTYDESVFAATKNAYVDAYTKEVAKAAVAKLVDAEEMTYGTAKYFELEWAKVEEAVAAYYAAVDAAEVTADMTDAKSALDKAVAADKIKQQGTILTEIQGLSVFATEAGKLVKYVNYLDQINTGDNALQYEFDVTNNGEVAEWYAEQGARTAAEVTALYDEACAALAGSATKADADAAKKAVEEQIAALGAAPEKEAVKAAFDAAAETTISSIAQTNLNTAIKAVASKEAAQVAELAKAIEKLTTKNVTSADKEAIKAYAAAVKAYNEDKMYDAVGLANITDSVSTGLLNAIKAAEEKAVEDAIEALPAAGKVTVADKAAVEAARAAYDAYVAEYTDYEKPFNAANDIDATKLEAAEDALVILTAFGDADAKAYVQDLKIVARSVKTAKGNVKVTINADVEKLIENGYTVEYKFYRSEKARAKYGTAKKVSEENVYTNTAGKKGVQYFYKAKLVVKNEAGEVVATTPLTQCKYATRVWSK